MTTFSSKTSTILENARALFGKQVDAIVRQEHKVVELVQNVGKRLSKLAHNPKVQKLTAPVQVFIRMIKAHFSGQHKMAFSSLAMIVLAMVYFISPIDLIPDFLGFFGFADDLTVILTVYAKLKDEIDSFLDWERTQL
jgi:uncharacterized membrane protein YkvA (DUF1232 family)